MSDALNVIKEKTKRDIFKFNGVNPTAINLEHVTMITVNGKTITFSFITNGLNIDMESEEIAKAVFDQLLNVWASDVVA